MATVGGQDIGLFGCGRMPDRRNANETFRQSARENVFLRFQPGGRMTMRPYSRRAARQALDLSGVVARRCPRLTSEVDDGQELSERTASEVGLAIASPHS